MLAKKSLKSKNISFRIQSVPPPKISSNLSTIFLINYIIHLYSSPDKSIK